MATEVIKIVDPDNGSGTNYTSLSAWEAGEQGDLTGVRDEIAVAKCRCTGGTADDGRVYIDGWTCDSTHYIKIWTDTAESYRHTGKWETGNKYRHVMTEDEAANFYIVENYVRIIGLQISTTTYVGRAYCRGIFFTDGAIGGTASHNIIKDPSNTSYSSGLNTNASSQGPFYFYNNIVYDFAGTSSNGILLDNNDSAGNSEGYVYNNTVVNCANGVLTWRANTHDIINNLISGCTTAFEGGFRNSYNNATNNASLGSSYGATNSANNRTSQTFSFVGAADFHLQAGDNGAKGHGLNLYNDANYPFQTDIDGQDRGGSGAQWDIGADEYVAAYPYYAYAQQ